MRKFIFSVAVTAACCCCLLSCNEKPKNYKFVKVMPDGKEIVDDIKAMNDTDAVKQFFSQMEKMFVDNAESPYKVIYLISPAGDTLNTNEELMKAVLNPIAVPVPAEGVAPE